jgi:hypothetical protein
MEDAMTNVPSTFPKPAEIDDGRNDVTTKYESRDVAVVDATARRQESPHPSGVLGELALARWRSSAIQKCPGLSSAPQRKSLLGFSPDGRKSS